MSKQEIFMNCKPGDLAIIVRSIAGNEGKIVRLLRLHTGSSNYFFGGPRWVIDAPVTDCWGFPINSLADACLRPIRDQEGDDETFSWAGKPTELVDQT